MDRWIDGCMGGFMDGWMGGWIITVDSLSIRGPDPGTPTTDLGGNHAAHMHMSDPTRMHCTQSLKDYQQPGMYKPILLKQPASRGQTGCSRPPPSPKESNL